MDSRYLAHGQELRELRIDFSGKVKAKNPPTTRLCDSLKSTPESRIPVNTCRNIQIPKFRYHHCITLFHCSHGYQQAGFNTPNSGINRPGFQDHGLVLLFLRRREERLCVSFLDLSLEKKVPNIFSHMVV